MDVLPFYEKDKVAVYIFPYELRSEGAGKPSISFLARKEDTEYPMALLLPIPQGLPVQDNLTYGQTNLNQIGKVAQDMLGGKTAEQAIQGIKSGMSGDTTTNAAALAQISAKVGLTSNSGIIGTAAEAVMYNKKALLNPNQVSTFNGSNTRSFTFDFKLVAVTQKETELINNIVERLRLNAYPAGSDIILKYPPKFTIEILDRNLSINQYYSPIDECYLTAINVAYNTSGNAHYASGAPLDVTLTLSFMETKALTRKDIERLQNIRRGKEKRRPAT